MKLFLIVAAIAVGASYAYDVQPGAIRCQDGGLFQYWDGCNWWDCDCKGEATACKGERPNYCIDDPKDYHEQHFWEIFPIAKEQCCSAPPPAPTNTS